MNKRLNDLLTRPRPQNESSQLPVSALSRPSSTKPEIRRLLRQRRLSRINFPLLIGVPLVLLFVIIAIFGPWLSPHHPIERFDIVQDDNGNFHVPPFKPGEVAGFPLGTDHIGRDVASRLLWAPQPTFFLVLGVALCRILIGTLVGLLEGWHTGRTSDLIRAVGQAAGALPMLIVAMLTITIFSLAGLGDSTGPFLLALTITGWAGPAKIVAERVRLLRTEPYIEASRALGASDLRIVFKHLLPQVMTILPVILAFEMSATLLVTAELGFLKFFIGGAEMFAVPNGRDPGVTLFPVPGMPELGQMLSVGWDNFFLEPWVAVWVGATFFYAIFAFMMLGEGLKRRIARGTHRQMPARLLADRFTVTQRVPASR